MTTDDPLVRTTAHSASIVLGDHDSTSRKTAKEWIDMAPAGWIATLEEQPRSLEQSAKFYAICTQLAKSPLIWDGERQTKRAWHDLLIHAWMVDTHRSPRLVPGLHGGRVSLLLGTRDMTKSEMSELIEATVMWATSHGIEIKEDP